MGINRWDAYVTYFSSLKNFYVNNKNDLQTIQDISTSLQLLEENESSTLDSVHIGDLVAAKYEYDGLWYRAKVLSIEKNAFTVQFIDYGNSELSLNLKKLPEKLANYRQMAYQCKLDNVDDEDHIVVSNNEVYGIVFEFITSVEFVLTFSNKDKHNVIKMEWDDRNIKTILNNIISFGITFQTYETLKQFDQFEAKMQVNLIYVASINEFYVETEYSEEIKNKIEYELENRTVWIPVTEFKFGKMVIAKSMNDYRWYRVRILEKLEEGQYNCYFIDYGVQEKCAEFYEVVGCLESSPPFIKRCSLYLPKMVKSKHILTSLSNSFFDEMSLCQNKKMTMNVVKVGEPCVVELCVDSLNVFDIIKPISVFVFRVFHFNAFTVQVNTPGRLYVISQLKKIKSLSQVKHFKIGKMYGAYVDGQWCRVILEKKINKQLLEVVMVDMGCINIEVDKLFALPTDLEEINYITLHCSLGLDRQCFSTKKLQDICDDGKTKFRMVVLKSDSVVGHHVQLLLNGKDVKNNIRRKMKH